jgi:hypothetical protein
MSAKVKSRDMTWVSARSVWPEPGSVHWMTVWRRSVKFEDCQMIAGYSGANIDRVSFSIVCWLVACRERTISKVRLQTHI